MSGKGSSPARVRVLVVDDALFMRAKLREILEGSGRYQVVEEAGNGREGVEAYRRARPDLVLMDIVMPEMDGIEATRRILAEAPSAVVVICSALGQEELVIDSVRAGARDFLVKPYVPERLLDVLDQVLTPV